MTNSSVTSTENLVKFQGLLRELFQFDCADLDFGIYRIMNHKREAIEKFISVQLPAAVESELKSGSLAEQTRATARLEEVTQKVRSTLGKDAIGENSELSPEYHGAPIGQEYLVV